MVSVLCDLLTSKKIAPSLIRVEKIFFKIEHKGYQKKQILRWFKKCVELLRQEVPKDLLSENRFLAKFSQVPKNQFFCKNFFPFAKLKISHFWNQCKIPLFLIPCTPNFEEIFFQLV